MSAVSHQKTLTMADFTGTVTVFNSQASTTTIAATDIWRPSNVNSAHDQFVTISGNTSNLSTSPAVSNIVLAGGSNITLSMATAAGVASITISGGDPIISRFTDFGAQGGPATSTGGIASASFRIFEVPSPITFTRVDIPVFVSATSTATSNTFAIAISSAFVIYSNNASTLSPIIGMTSQTTHSWASNSANWSSLTGGKYLSFPLSTVLTIGEYYAGFSFSTQSSSVGAATTSTGAASQFPITMQFNSQQNSATPAFADLGSTASASTNSYFAGIHTNSITATNQTIAMSNISVTGSQWHRANVPLIFRNL